MYPHLVGFHLVQHGVVKDPHDVAQGGVADICMGV